jgi:hypothetical protein
MANLTSLLNQLQRERKRLHEELDNVSRALAALGRKHKRRKLSAAAIARIRAGQKARWAKWRKAQKKR